MSEINEEFLIEDNVDFDDIEPADEEALLQDDDDVLDLNETPEDEGTGESADGKVQTDNEEEESSRKDKVATERQKITAPDSSSVNDKPSNTITPKFRSFNNNRSRGRGRGRGGRYQYSQNRANPFNQEMRHNSGNQPGRNKTVLINPRFQGVVHVNNNARLAWDAPRQGYQPTNPWLPNLNNNGLHHMSQMNSMPSFPPSNMQGSIPFQNQGPQYRDPQQMQAIHGPLQHMNQGTGLMNQPPPHINVSQPPPMQNVGFPSQQNNMMPPGFGQPNFVRPPPMGQGFGQPMPSSGLPPAAQPYWERLYPVGFPQCPTPQMNNAYMHFESPPPQILNVPPPQYNPQQTFVTTVQPNSQLFENKAVPVQQFQRKKRMIHERLGTVNQVKVRKYKITDGDRQPKRVVRELSVTSVTKVQTEEDSETRDLRLKIEEQKRKREEVLKWKEARRMESLKASSGQAQLNRQQPKQYQSIPIPNIVQAKNRLNQHQQNRGHNHQTGGRIPVLRQLKQVAEEQQRQSVVKLPPDTAAPDVDIQLDQKHMSNFLTGRKVLVKDETLPATRRVMIKNLSTSTRDKKLFQICKSIGEVQNLHRDKNDRHATITFKSVASAHAFFKKYQRHMLDLSMIEVSLTSDTDGQDEH